jgi:hypothetical protein
MYIIFSFNLSHAHTHDVCVQDCFRGAFATALASGQGDQESLRLAAAASAHCVTVSARRIEKGVLLLLLLVVVAISSSSFYCVCFFSCVV